MIIDVDQGSFVTEVLERSRHVPVVVDFWASWCAPCRILGPVLEQEVASRDGELVLAKVDVDANPDISRSYGIRGIPAVKAFRGGAVVAEFTGAQPRPAVERFLDALVPSPADRLAAAGDEASLRRALEIDPGHVAARVALGRLLLEQGDVDGALVILTPVEHDPVAAGLLARARLAALIEPPPTVREALATLESDPDRALTALTAAVREGDGEVRDLARRLAVGLFGELGEDHPLVAVHRPRLAAALY